MVDADDYESLPDSTPFRIVALAGAAAGVAEHCTMYPVDSVKTRMQSVMCEKQHRDGIYRMLKTMVKEEGWFRPLRGGSAMAMGAGPAHAMYFGCLEMGKTSTVFAPLYNISPIIGNGVTPVFATICHDAVMTPAEVVKQRMQMCCSPHHSTLKCARTIYTNEGIRAFYRSYSTALTMNIPYQIAMFETYELTQSLLNPQKEYKPMVHFAAGAVAGGVASFITMPLDVCKTLLNTQESAVLQATKKTELKGGLNAVKTIYRMAGLRGFFNGLTPRVLYQAPSTAISWSVYEFFKWWLFSPNENSGPNSESGEKTRAGKGYDYDTLSVMKSATASGQIGSRVGHLSPGASAHGEHGEHLVSQESIQVAVTLPSSRLL